MKFTSGKPTLDENTGEATSGSEFKSPEELITFARDYFSSDFPNPERPSCPPPGTLRALVRSGKLPDDKLRGHLFGCSECFQEHRNAMVAHRNTVSTQTISWWSRLLAALTLKPVPPIAPWIKVSPEFRLAAALTLKPVPVIASVFSLLLLSIIGAYVWRGPAPISKSSDDPSKEEFASATPLASPTPEISPSPVTPTEQAPSRQTRGRTNQRTAPAQRPRLTDQRPRELIAMNTVRIDLEEYTVSRGEEAGGGAAKEIKLSRSRTRLTLRLPEGSVKGLYTVSIVDPSDKPLVTAKASSADGRTITTTLNIQGLTSNKYRLRVARQGEAPDYYLIVVGDEKTFRDDRRP